MTSLRQPQPLILTRKMKCATQRAHLVDVQIHCSKSQSIERNKIGELDMRWLLITGEPVQIHTDIKWMSLDPLLTTRHNERLLWSSQKPHSPTAAVVMAVSWREATVGCALAVILGETALESGWCGKASEGARQASCLADQLPAKWSFQLWDLHSVDALSHCQSFLWLTQLLVDDPRTMIVVNFASRSTIVPLSFVLSAKSTGSSTDRSGFGTLLVQRWMMISYGRAIMLSAAAEKHNANVTVLYSLMSSNKTYVTKPEGPFQRAHLIQMYSVQTAKFLAVCAHIHLHCRSFCDEKGFLLLAITCDWAWNKVGGGWPFSISQSRYLQSKQKFSEGRQSIISPICKHSEAMKAPIGILYWLTPAIL